MKKILFVLLICLCLIPSVNAEEIVFDASKTYENINSLNNAINKAYEIIKTSEYKYYTIEIIGSFYLNLYLFNDITNYEITSDISNFDDGLGSVSLRHFRNVDYNIYEDGTVYSANYSDDPNNSLLMHILDNLNKKYSLYDTNFDYTINTTLNIAGIYSDIITLKSGDLLPRIKTLQNYDSWDSYYDNATYTTVNLDNYEYVILNLKDYNKKAFETNLKVKGMIGITPVYEFGTVEKSNITDRCNISYDDFTNYRFFVLENDLLNNAVYVVKKCQNNSGFKFDSTIFDITYVTAENVDDPVITFGGKDYHTIPFKQLSNTANKNEEENFVPGANEEFKPFDDITNYISSFWDSLTTFMSLVTKFFNTLPIEIRAIAITTFMTGCTLGLIKIIKS